MWGWGIGGIGGIRGEGVPDIFTKNNKGGQLIPPYFLSNFLHVVLHFFLCLEAGFFRFTGKSISASDFRSCESLDFS